MASKSAPATVTNVSQEGLVHTVGFTTIVVNPGDVPAITGEIKFAGVTGNPFASGDPVTVTVTKN